MFWLEGFHLELYHYEAVQARVVEEQIDVEVLAVDLEMVLAPDEGEAVAELEEEVPEVSDEGVLELTPATSSERPRNSKLGLPA